MQRRFPVLGPVLTICIVLGFGVLIFSAWRASSKQEEAEKRASQKRNEAQSQIVQASISRLLSRSNADADWREPLRGRSAIERIPSSDLAPILVRTDPRPILFFGSVESVTALNGKRVVQLVTHVNFGTRLRLVLVCPTEIAEAFALGAERGFHFAVAARIESVGAAEVFSTDGGGKRTVPVAQGYCTDTAEVGSYQDEKAMTLFRNPYP